MHRFAFACLVTIAALGATPAKAQIPTWIGEHRALCYAYFGLNPDAEHLPRIPVICGWRPVSYICDPANDPPEGWLRPGGFCEQAMSTKSIMGKGDGGYSPPKEPECPTYPTAAPPPNNCLPD